MKGFLARTIPALALATTPAWLSAQAPSKPPEPAHKTIRLVGCLQPGANPTFFKLTNASEPEPAPGVTPDPVPVGTSGRTREYELMPHPDVDLKLSTHIGHQVEISARPIEVAPARSSPPASGGATLVVPAPQLVQEQSRERVTVTAVTRLASPCP